LVEDDVKVEEFMSRNARACLPDAPLVEAARLMRETPCGFLPVRTVEGKLTGVITDRDICMAVARIDRPARDIRVAEAMTPDPLSCTREEDVLAAVHRMQKGHVHRLPVLSREGDLEGVLSIDDVIDRAGEAWEQPLSGVSLGEVVPVLQALHERIVRRAAWEKKPGESGAGIESMGPARPREAREH
jgi:CBS domain-containing protein